MVGHIYNYRDPTNIILAMPAILRHFPNAKFNIAGKIRFRRPINEVKRLGLESSVKFLGEVSTDQVSKLVSSAHVFAILHQLEYTSISLTSFEAMNFGTPVVTNAPENLYGNSMIKDGENIVLINRDNVDEIAEKIISIIKSKSIITKFYRKTDLDSILDISKAENKLGFKPKTCLDEGLKYEIEWHKKNK